MDSKSKSEAVVLEEEGRENWQAHESGNAAQERAQHALADSAGLGATVMADLAFNFVQHLRRFPRSAD